MESKQRLTLSRIARAAEQARAMEKEVWLSDDIGLRGIGRLLLRATPRTTRLYFRHTHAGQRKTIPLGPFSKNPRAGYLTLQQARDLSQQHLAKALGEASAAERSSYQSKTLEDAAGEVAESGSTLQDLCNAYVLHLNNQGKSSARQVANAFRLTVTPSPFAAMPARLVTSEQLTDLLREMVSRGVGKSAASLRSHLHAAYECAIASRLNPCAPAGQHWRGMTTNPVSPISSLAGLCRPRQRALSEDELSEVLRRLNRLAVGESVLALCARAIRLNLYLAGQRGEQLLSVPLAAVNFRNKPVATVLLLDGKGNRAIARQHVLPLVGPALPQALWFAERSRRLGSPWLFCSADPEIKLRQNDLSKLVHCISRDMMTQDPLCDGVPRTPFKFLDLRRTVETVLSSMKIDMEARAHLLSHGLSGIQPSTYDMWDHMDDKLRALGLWHAVLQRLESNPPKRS